MATHSDARARAGNALRLRATGATWDQVAEQTGFRSRQAARQAVDRLVKSTVGDVETERAVSNEALRVLTTTLFGRFAVATRERDDDLVIRYAKELRGLLSEQAKMNGLYAPQRVEHEVEVTSATAILDRAEADLLALARSPRPPQTVIDAEVIP